MKIVSYNVNGIRAAIKKGLYDWIKEKNPDVVCIQELKAKQSQVDVKALEKMNFFHYWMPAEKPGYSGVAIFSKIKPENIKYGCGIEKYDLEGRTIRVDFPLLSIICVYMPSGTSGDERQSFKIQWLKDFSLYIVALKKSIPNLIIVGDYNIAHKEIDIHNPKANKKNSGFLPEEREWVSSFLDTGFVDSFRKFHADPHRYSWWTYRFGARKSNKGWRIDYQMVSSSLEQKILAADVLSSAFHSDHCPTYLEVDV